LRPRPRLRNAEPSRAHHADDATVQTGRELGRESAQGKRQKVCTTDWNERDKATEWSESWAKICNEYLATNGHDARIDHRSYAEQGINKIPSVHLGVSATQMERRGVVIDRGNINRAIVVGNPS
jgi:ATP-dependent exoDNAse (exonuclease V) alpha subunit